MTSPQRAPRVWHLVRSQVEATREGKKYMANVIVAVGPMPEEFERIEVTETGDASGGVIEPDDWRAAKKGD